MENETANYIVSKCCNLAQKDYESMYDRVEKLIHW